MSITKHLLAFALGACLTAQVSAQESLIDVYQRALMNDPAIREAEANYLATAEVKPQARSQLLPSLTLGANRSHTFNDTEIRSGATDPITGLPTGSRQTSEQYATGWRSGIGSCLDGWGVRVSGIQR